MTLIMIGLLFFAFGTENISESENPLSESVFLKAFGIFEIILSAILYLVGFWVFLTKI